MNWAQFKDPVSHMCLAGTVVVSWSLTQEVAGLKESSLVKFFSPKFRLKLFINYRPQTKFGAKVICLQVCVCPRGWCLLKGGCLLQGGAWWRPTLGRPPLWAVHILLECILVRNRTSEQMGLRPIQPIIQPVNNNRLNIGTGQSATLCQSDRQCLVKILSVW